MPTGQALQVFYGTLPLVAAILLANWNNNKRLDDLNKRIDDLGTSLNKRIDDLAMTVNTGFADVKTRLSDLEEGTHLIRS